MIQHDYMKRAIKLAKAGCGFVNPNPMVGAVIVKNGEIIGEGYHRKYGELHAERDALNNCITSPKEATLYVTLEPCCHYGKTPPCTDAILKSGIKKVVIGSCDPNPIMQEKGIALLRKHGIKVIEHVLEEECNKLNEVFFHYITTNTPYVIMKYAMTMDGKIATHCGKSKWITGELAREYVHRQRHKYSSIMVGVKTILVDDPLLTCRVENGKNPIRIICDTNLRTPLNAKVITTAKAIKTIIATASTSVLEQRPYWQAGCEIITVPKRNRHLDLKKLMKKLGTQEIDSVLIEGGGALHWSALQSQIVNKHCCYIAPKLFGGEQAKTPIAGIGIENPDHAFFLKNSKVLQLGDDFLIESEVQYSCLQE